MANNFPAQVRVNPHFAEPDLIVTYAQASGAFAALPGNKPKVKLGNDDLYVYINALDLRTETLSAQAAGNFLPSATLVGTQYSTQTYLIRTRSIWDHHDIAAAAHYNVSLPAAQDLAARQGIYQQMRTALLYGYQPSNNEGLLNAAAATAVTLPPDQYGNTTASTYDNGDMSLWLLSQIVNIKSGMFQSGAQITNRIRFIGPQRILLNWQLANIVRVTAYQRPGAGTSTTGQVVANVTAEAGDEVEYYFDDTLQGKGAGGADMVILTIPEIEQPDMPGINTNVFGDVQPSTKAVNAMYTDMPAPMKIPTPIPDGAITEVQEMRISSGWNLRGQGLYLLSIPH
ncbi:DUF2184 domain-containing protein [Paraburkholderia acidisoli]|uniref:DUF2184 domain-containing protein n=1 Tax=Paraburkholderia acidisoli TaxID=2571748 RepID=A0A7Z2GRQ8_9BURK|nr:DUF2184 domain-containing protein [Paraburkholderia acidisoli]QGZ66364.1 DUF2184 domain-containing protein [Paraburkholderia acidisoli]